MVRKKKQEIFSACHHSPCTRFDDTLEASVWIQRSSPYISSLVSFYKLFECELPSEVVLPYNHPPSQWQLFSNCCMKKNFQIKVYNKAEEISI